MTTTEVTMTEKSTKKNGAPPPTTIEHLPLTDVQESPVNPRKVFKGLEELAADVELHGILQPLTVRTVAKGYEIVFGARRYRAAKLAGLRVLPCIVRDLSDLEAYERMVVENGQREDLHPLEEAESYEHLHKVHKLSVDEIAAKVGQNKAHVYARMKLLALCPEARKAFYDEKITPSVALYIARIPHEKLQAEALKDLVPRHPDEDVIGAREAFHRIEHRYMLRLAEAPFDRADAELVPAAGACKDCPKRTGNQKELFADVKSPDVCIDPVCFDAKRQAHIVRERARLEATGVKVLTAKSQYSTPEGYRRLDEHLYEVEHGTKHWGKPLSTVLSKVKDQIAPVVMLDEEGHTHKLVPKKDVAKLLKEAGVKTRKDKALQSSAVTKEQRAARKRAEQLADLHEEILGEVETLLVKKGSSDNFLRAIGFFIAGSAVRWSNLKGGQLVSKLFQYALDFGGSDTEPALRFACAAVGLDLAKREKEHLARAAEAKAALPPSKPSKASKASAKPSRKK